VFAHRRGPLCLSDLQGSIELVHVLNRDFVADRSEIVHHVRNSSRPQPALGAAIRVTREKRGEKQQAVADRAGIALPTLSHIEAGHANPTWATVRDIADALGVSIGQLAKLAEKQE
jgi:DNA-binding XRE family transcriptional regulator